MVYYGRCHLRMFSGTQGRECVHVGVSECHHVVRPWPCGGARPMLSSSPLCSPDGYLYEREAILEYILHQKKEIARQMKVMRTEK